MFWTLVLVAAAGEREEEHLELDFGAAMPKLRMKATVGGAQDIRYFRDRAENGELPLPEVFTPEGLFSEHDLPLPASDCDRLLCVDTAASQASLLAQEDVRWLGQIGFSSNLTAATFERPPLNLVAVVDKSCSMTDAIEHVKTGLSTLVDTQLTEGDQLSIVLYGDTVHTHLAPTSDPAAMREAIASIAIEGSTYMEAGLTHGFALARETRRRFDGTTRVMLFTDERPNVGNTDKGGFMELARSGSHDGIGMTTVGVGVQFGAELATAVSSVRGGNLYYFADGDTMTKELRTKFPEWVTELAYDLELRVEPNSGARVAGIYGVPGDAVAFDGDALVVKVETLFLSSDAGAIYVGFAPDGHLPLQGAPGRVRLTYTARDGEVAPQSRAFTLGPPPLGLARGRLLVDEATTLKKAMHLHHHDNDQAGAYALVHALAQRFHANHDATLDPERTLIDGLEATLAKASGNGEPASTSHQTAQHEISGLPILVR